MEHLPVPKGTRPIDIPYVRTRDPYRGPFLDYPMHIGWKVRPDGELDFPWDDFATDRRIERREGVDSSKENEKNRIDAFIQTWLFFGCLIEVFGIVGIKVKESDFIREGKFITTAKLPELIEQWKDREDLPGEALAEGRPGRYNSIMKILEKVQFYEKYCYDAYTDEYGPTASAWSVEPAISLSIMALGWALKSAAYTIYDPKTRHTRQQWGYSYVLDNRMRDGGWCWGERAKLRSDVEIDGVFYFASLQSPRREQDHRDCCSTGCSGKGIDESQYKTKHAKHGCTCGDVKVPGNVIEIIKKGGIPLMSWTQQSGLKVVEYDAQSKQEYVAISHV